MHIIINTMHQSPQLSPQLSPQSSPYTQNANVVSVRILDCDGYGSIANTIAALDWVAVNAVKPAVVLLSLGIPVRR